MKREKLDRLGEILQESVNKHEIAGGNLLVMHHGEEIYYAQAGMADIAQGKGIERDSLFRLYSMSKPVTSAAVMLLMERGIVDLLDPISKYIPSFAESMVATEHGDEKAVRQVTVKDCLSMTSGLVYNCDPDPASKDTAVTVLSAAHNTFFKFIFLFPSLFKYLHWNLLISLADAGLHINQAVSGVMEPVQIFWELL